MEELKSSIVHEYSILYSNRIIQKDKKWNDGKLKYYEFNNKLEIFNEDGNLIEVDFISEKFKHNLVEQNEFKLPNNRLIIEIDCKLSSYARDVSDLFKRSAKSVELTSSTKNGITKIKTEPNQIKQERVIKPTVYRPLKHEPFKKITKNQVMIKQECPRIKQEYLPRIKQEFLPRTKHETMTQSVLGQPSPRPLIKEEPIEDRVEESASNSEVQLHNSRSTKERKPLPRIFPKSSRLFKHLATSKT